MNILSAFVVVLLVMLVVVFMIPGEKKNAIRWTMAAGSFVLLGMAIYLVKDFLDWKSLNHRAILQCRIGSYHMV